MQENLWDRNLSYAPVSTYVRVRDYVRSRRCTHCCFILRSEISGQVEIGVLSTVAAITYGIPPPSNSGAFSVM